MKKVFMLVVLLAHLFYAHAQCPTGNYAGSVTITSDCTISSSLTVTGDFVISNSATLTVNSGVTLTVTGDLESGYEQGVITVNGGGTIEVGGRFYNRVRNITSFTFSDVTVSVNNTGTDEVLNNYTSSLSLLNGTNFTVVQGNFLNDNLTDLTIDNSTLTITSGDFTNDFQSALTIQNSGSLVISDGNLITENESSLSVNDSDVYVNGNFNNDYNADLDIVNGSDVTITGNFNNGFGADGTEVTSGSVNIDASTVSVGGDLNNDYGSDISVDSGGGFAVDGNVSNDNTATIDVTDGSFSYDGTLSDPGSGLSSPSGDDCTDGCCGSACSTLPVELAFFKVNSTANSISLEWQTASETNNDYFNIHKSTDGIVFEIVQQVQGNGTSNQSHVYEWTDYAVTQGTYYYQLEQVDYDGKNEFFDIVSTHLTISGDDQPFSVYPVPVGSAQNLRLSGSGFQIDSFSAVLTTVSGHRSYAIDALVSSNLVELGLSGLGLTPGIYMLQIQSAGQTFNTKILVQ